MVIPVHNPDTDILTVWIKFQKELAKIKPVVLLNTTKNTTSSRDGHRNGNGLEFPFPQFPEILWKGMKISTEAIFPLFPGILGMRMKNFTAALFSLIPGISGIRMTSSGNPKQYVITVEKTEKSTWI